MYLQKSIHSQQKSTDCVVTVFLAVAFVCVASLILALTESAHISAVRYHARTAASSAADSLFSNYHNELWDRYRLLFLEAENEKYMTDLLEKYIVEYSHSENWFRFRDASFGIVKSDRVTSGEGEWLEQEILDYMDLQ